MRWLLPLCLATPALGDAPEILDARAMATGATWSVAVTLRHGDTGWDDYAEAWRIVTEDGTEIARRVLLHPHVAEQPFTRAQGGLTLDPARAYFIEARSLGEPWGTTRLPLRFD